MLVQAEVRRFTQGSHQSELAARHPVPPPWEDPIAEDLTLAICRCSCYQCAALLALIDIQI